MTIERYAVIEEATVLVENVIVWDGNTEQWQPDLGYIAVLSETTQIGWLYDNGIFTAPIVIPPVPTPAEIEVQNKSLLNAYSATANAQVSVLKDRISIIEDGIAINEALPEEVEELAVRKAQLIEWQRYALYLGRVTKQVGWALAVDWPVQPVEGMELSVHTSS